MKHILVLCFIGAAFTVNSCKIENPVSHNTIPEDKLNKIQSNELKNEPDYSELPCNMVFQINTIVSESLKKTIIEMTGNGYGTQVGNAKIFSFSKMEAVPVKYHSGSIDITAENGNKIAGKFLGTAVFLSRPKIINLNGDFVITGGTGNFAGVTGSGKYNGRIYEYSSTGIITFDGIISMPEVIRFNR